MGVLLVVAVAIAATAEAKSGKKHDGGCATLAVEASLRVPVPELSGLASADASGGTVVYGIGDASYRIARVGIDGGSGNPHIETLDASKLFPQHHGASQWEAIATHAGGACVLSELTSRVTCFDKDLARVTSAFDLDVSAPPKLAKAWKKDANSRGEGLILLARGHVLVVKEKDPVLLVELGPRGAAPLGYGADALLPRDAAFDVPAEHVLTALATWEPSKRLAKAAHDASDLTVGPDRRVYVLSDESGTLIRLAEPATKSDAVVDVDACWGLPKPVRQPEGVVIDAKMRPWIAIDDKESVGPNLFRLSPLDRAAE